MYETLAADHLEQAPGQEVILRRDDAADITAPLLLPGQVADVARVRAAEAADSYADELKVIDVRQAPVDEYGKIVGDRGQARIHPASQYLLADIRADWDQDTGFTPIFAGNRPFVYGKHGDRTERFPGMNKRITSGSHFSAEVTQVGVRIVDLGSTNHTAVTEIAKQRQTKIEKLSHAVGQALTQKPEKSRLNTAPEGQRRMLSEAERLDYLRFAVNQSRSNSKLTYEAMAITPEVPLAPVAAVRLGDKEFAFTKIIDGSHKQALCYVRLPDGEILPRIYYKSKSDGGWRVTPHIETHHNDRYNKGNVSEDGAYVQLTKPVEEISQLLESLDASSNQHIKLDESSEKRIRQLFSTAQQYKEMYAFFDGEIQHIRLSDSEQRGLYDAYQPGKGYVVEAEIARHELANIVTPEGFEPDFAAGTEMRSYDYDHTLAGPATVRVYGAQYKGEPIEWHIAEAADGAVWADKITYADENHQNVGTYGTPSRVLLAGAYSAKPFEYKQQLDDMEEGKDYVSQPGRYASLRPYWDRTPLVRRYRQQRAIAGSTGR